MWVTFLNCISRLFFRLFSVKAVFNALDPSELNIFFFCIHIVASTLSLRQSYDYRKSKSSRYYTYFTFRLPPFCILGMKPATQGFSWFYWFLQEIPSIIALERLQSLFKTSFTFQWLNKLRIYQKCLWIAARSNWHLKHLLPVCNSMGQTSVSGQLIIQPVTELSPLF